MSDKRRHRATGNPRGGRREGAGAKPGLPTFAIPALKSLRHRVPEGTPEELASIADRAFQQVVAVMEGVHLDAESATVLKAAATLREEICGPVAQKVQHQGANGEPLEIVVRTETSGHRAVPVNESGPSVNPPDEPPASD